MTEVARPGDGPGPLTRRLAVVAASVLVLAVLFAATSIPRWIPPAPLARLGIASPLTGMTRSFVALARGDVAAAFGYHPLGPVLFAACVVAAVAPFSPRLRLALASCVATRARRRWTITIAAIAAASAWARQIIVDA